MTKDAKIAALELEIVALKALLANQPRIKFTAHDVGKLKSEKRDSLILQYRFTMEFPDESAWTIRNCIAGVGKNGPWATPPLDRFKTITCNKKAQENMIEAFQKEGLLDGLEPSWIEEEKVTVEWQK